MRPKASFVGESRKTIILLGTLDLDFLRAKGSDFRGRRGARLPKRSALAGSVVNNPAGYSIKADAKIEGIDGRVLKRDAVEQLTTRVYLRILVIKCTFYSSTGV